MERLERHLVRFLSAQKTWRELGGTHEADGPMIAMQLQKHSQPRVRSLVMNRVQMAACQMSTLQTMRRGAGIGRSQFVGATWSS